MDLKDFAKETVKAITLAAHELQLELKDAGAIINPPTTGSGNDTFEVGGTRHTLRRVQNIEFDLALSTSSSTSAGGKGGMKILVVEASADAAHARTSEEVSRVKFSIPLALPASDQESTNRQAQQDRMQKPEQPIPARIGFGAERS
jgi:hypothetical protein